MTALNHLNTTATTSELPTVNNATLTIQRNGTTIDTFTANDATNTTANIAAVTSVATGGGLTGGTITNTGTISHADTSSQGSVNNSGSNFIQDITLDAYGHVTGITTASAGGGTPGQTATGSYVMMQNNRRNTPYNPGNTFSPNGDGNERYGVTWGRSNAGGSGDFNQRTTTGQGAALSGGTWRSQSAGVSNQYGTRLVVRIA